MVDEVVEGVVRFAGRATVSVALEFVFSKHGARYFHGIGRHFIAIVSLGKVRIPSSLRQVPKGTKPKPTAKDWIALIVGILIGCASAALVFFALFAL
jgi:hypothetical protein